MSASDALRAVSSPPIPRPRVAGTDAPLRRRAGAHAGSVPWPEPWRSADGARPRTEYWDVTTACWHSHAPQECPGD